MKNVFFSSLLILAVLFVSCEGKNKIIKFEDLKSVAFKEEADKEISAISTGRRIFDPQANKERTLYKVTVQKQYQLKPLSLVAETMSDIIYPGSIVRGDEFINGKYAPVKLKNEFEPVKLSVTLKGKDVNVSKSVLPILSEVRQAHNDMIAGQMDKIKGEFIPAVYTYESYEATTSQSFKRTLKRHC